MDPMSWSLSGKFTVKQNSNRKRLPNETYAVILFGQENV